ncbi:IS1096 element passenger TnpR family protein [Streptomyces argyrophylli]|uniref:IS1096 element passenger TnpR family protein n=1 Tax=Streptomyces argyrophylli TaxID=2726118 RepID=UPI0035AB84BD
MVFVADGRRVLEARVPLAESPSPIRRRLQVPADRRFTRPYLSIQTAMRWENYHRHLFTAPAGASGLRDSEPGHRDGRKALRDTVTATAGDTRD